MEAYDLVHICGEDIEIFTNLDSVVQSSGGSSHAIFQRTSLAYAVRYEYLAFLLSMQKNQDPDLQVVCVQSLSVWL